MPLGAGRATGQPYGPLALVRYPGADFNQIAGQDVARRMRSRISRPETAWFSASCANR